MSRQVNIRLSDDMVEFLQKEAKRQGKTQTELVEEALENMRSGDRHATDKLTEVWNDNGRIIAMLNDVLTGDIAQQLAFIYSKVAGKSAPKYDQEMMPKNESEIGLVTGIEKPHLLTHHNNIERAKTIFSYWDEWRSAGNIMPKMPQF